MGRTLDELGDSMSSYEFALHMADHRLYPWSEEARDAMLAQIAAVLVNIHRKKGAAATKVSDMMLFRRPEDFGDDSAEALRRFFEQG